MVNPLNQDNVKGWLGIVMSVVDRATPVTLLLILLLGGLFAHYMLRELQRTREMNLSLWQQRLEAEKAYYALALRCHQPGEGR